MQPEGFFIWEGVVTAATTMDITYLRLHQLNAQQIHAPVGGTMNIENEHKM